MTAPTLSVLPAEDKEAQQLQAQGAQYLAAAQTLEVVDQATLTEATNLLGFLAETKKQVENRRKWFVKPLNDHVKAINDWFHGIAAPLEQADSILRGKVLRYRQEEERKRREEEARLRRLAEEEARKRREEAEAAAKAAGEAPPEPELFAPPPVVVVPQMARTTKADFGAVQARKTWEFEIVDESQVPREFLMVNEKAIRAAVKAGVRNIPGVRIFETETLAVVGR